MHATDIVAWHCEGAIYCEDCMDDTSPEALEGIGGPVFADGAEGSVGSACGGACGCWLTPDLEWQPLEEVSEWRWSRCLSCNTQRPHSSESYRETRRAAWKGEGTCHNCGGKERF